MYSVFCLFIIWPSALKCNCYYFSYILLISGPAGGLDQMGHAISSYQSTTQDRVALLQ